MARPRKNVTPQFIAALDYHIKLRGWKIEDLAKNIGVSRATMYSRINSPETFCYDELQKIAKLFKVSVIFTPEGVVMKGV